MPMRSGSLLVAAQRRVRQDRMLPPLPPVSQGRWQCLRKEAAGSQVGVPVRSVRRQVPGLRRRISVRNWLPQRVGQHLEDVQVVAQCRQPVQQARPAKRSNC